MPIATCPKCQGDMTAGFIIDFNMSQATAVSKWQEGAPQRSFWTGIKMDPERQHPITTYRCEQCGFLESYATG